MKIKTKNLVAFAATCALGAAAITGVAFGANALLNNSVYPHAGTEIVEAVNDGTLDFGENKIELTANEAKTFAIDSVNPGYYYFQLLSGSVKVTVDGTTADLLAGQEFYVFLDSPESADVVLLSENGGEIVLNLTYTLNEAKLTVGNNSLTIPKGEDLYAIVAHSGIPETITDEEGNVIVSDHAQAGDYTFSSTSQQTVQMTCTTNGEPVTYTLGRGQSAVTIRINDPLNTVLKFSSTNSNALKFILKVTYKEVEPDINISKDTLKVGANQVTADWFGVYYNFTAEEAGTYVLNCTDKNAFIMIETEYGEEQILWDWVEVEEGVFEEVYKPFVFTLAEGETYTFLMACNEVDEATGTATYIVNIALAK